MGEGGEGDLVVHRGSRSDLELGTWLFNVDVEGSTIRIRVEGRCKDPRMAALLGVKLYDLLKSLISLANTLVGEV